MILKKGGNKIFFRISKTVGAYETGDLGFIPKSRPASEMSKEERKPKEKEKTPKTAKSKGKS